MEKLFWLLRKCSLMKLISLPGWALAILILPLTMNVASSKVVVKEQTKYYNISGNSGKQIHAKFGRRGPWKLRRKRAIAATEREFDFKNIRVAERGKKCVVTHVDIHLSLTYFFPNLMNIKSASPVLQRNWRRLLKELVRHEKTHGRYFKETMRKIERELLKIKAKPSRGCRGVAGLVRRTAIETYQKAEARHEAFDRREQQPTSKVRKLENAFRATR